MPTAPQIKKFLKPLLSRNQDLVMLGRSIYVRPIRHISRMVLIEHTSDANRCYPRYFVGLLDHGSMSYWHDVLRHPPPLPVTWRWDDPNTVPYLIEAIENQALPVLRATDSFEAFEKLTNSSWSRLHIDQTGDPAIVFDAALGRLERARDRARKHRSAWTIDPAWPPEWGRLYTLYHALADALEDGERAQVARSLHDLERFHVEKWKLEPYWEPSPFPLELQP